MKSVFVALAAMAAVATAQIDQFPSCAADCFKSVVMSGVGDCKADDIACICKLTSFTEEMGSCAKKGCNDADYQKTVGVAYEFCKASGVTIATTIPTITPAPTAGPNNGTGGGGNITTSHTSTSTGGAANIVQGGLGVVGAVLAGLAML